MQVHNTLTKRKEELRPREPGKISMYVCGPTLYNHIHVGNARASIVFDTIRRYLVWRGFDVTFVQNYTDVDDKIIARAAEEARSEEEVATDYARAFEEVMASLDVWPPDVSVSATEHIGDMIDMIGRLIDGGSAYQAGGSVWFAVESFEGYGTLSGRTLDDMRAGERVEPDPSKRHPLDFALWKGAKEGEPAWESPWGRGRPGWHIECSAMSHRHLGMGFDIHGGGRDLIFPHHENEIAQSEAAFGESPFVRYWLHNGLVHMDDEKMSKSLGNIVLARDLVREVTGPVVRLMAISGHYRSDVDFGPDRADAARRIVERWSIFAERVKAADTPGPGGRVAIERFRQAMDDDFNTPQALGVIHDLVREANAAAAKGESVDAGDLAAAFRECTGVLGIGIQASDGGSGILADVLDILVEFRDRARRDGRFEDADFIRTRVGDLGVLLEDTPDGTVWRIKR